MARTGAELWESGIRDGNMGNFRNPAVEKATAQIHDISSPGESSDDDGDNAWW
jgi:hypothetical protein